MFESLTEKLSGIFDELTKRGALKEADVDAALREVSRLDADVALPVAKDFIANVRERAVGADVLKSVTPGQMVVKIVHDELVNTLAKANKISILLGRRRWPYSWSACRVPVRRRHQRSWRCGSRAAKKRRS